MNPERSGGLSTADGLRTRETNIPTPTVFRCAVTIVMVKIALSIWGFGRVITWLARRVEGVPATRLVGEAAVKTSERAVALAGALYPGRALCLEQSLALYYLLRRQGVPVKYCQGVIPRPFQAHAWIEYGGEVINDIPEHARQFARLPDLLP